MTTILERRLSEFVNRDNELRRFCEMMESDSKFIMVVWGEIGMGKSSLLARMIHECAQRKLRKAEFVSKDTRSNDYMAIMRKIRDDVGVDFFKPFTDLINFYTKEGYQPKIELNVTVAGSIKVAENAQIEGSTVGDISAVVIKDNMISVPRSDMAVPEAEYKAKLTDRFIECLSMAVKDGLLVVFFDAAEKMSLDTEKWIWEELFNAVRDGRLNNIRFILCGQNLPKLDRDWRILVEEAELQPLGLEHIINYLAKRGVDEASRPVLADMLLANTKGKISQIAEMVDAYLKLKERRGHGNG